MLLITWVKPVLEFNTQKIPYEVGIILYILKIKKFREKQEVS
jgi:hypothetical protein